MTIINYKAKRNIELLNKVFLEGDIIYVTESFYVMDGRLDYARKVFDENKNYLGMIRDSYFEDSIKNTLEQNNG
ncbi:MAG: hypothetical protein KGZ87_05440 [Bacteroidetes bacterium]|nr:hypothetical protein [Bacteroidota bacterium]